MSAKRPAAVAGMFYPNNPVELRKMVNKFLFENNNPGPAPKAIIAPHAGYHYSGPIAASAYSRLSSVAEKIKHVVLIGPAHRVAFEGLALHSADYFTTPLGDIALDKQANNLLLKLDFVSVFDKAHALEHSIEVQLPFLQCCLTEFKLTPILCANTSPEQIETALEILWGRDDTLIIISSDLSHYHDYDTARKLDADSSTKIESMSNDFLDSDHACGYLPVNGLLKVATNHRLTVTTADLRNSGDTAGQRDKVVGYGAYLFH